MRIGDPWGGKREEIALGPQLYFSNWGTSKLRNKGAEEKWTGREGEKGSSCVWFGQICQS